MKHSGGKLENDTVDGQLKYEVHLNSDDTCGRPRRLIALARFEQQPTGGQQPCTFNYSYTPAGPFTSETHPSGRRITNIYLPTTEPIRS